VFVNHVVARKGAFSYRLYMKAFIYEIIVYEEIGLVEENRR